MAEQAAFSTAVRDSPRGTRSGLFVDGETIHCIKLLQCLPGLFGPGMISKQARLALIRTTLRSDLDDYRHKPLWLDSMTTRIRALHGGMFTISVNLL